MIKHKPKETPTPKNISQVAESVKIGRALIAEGKSKVEAVRAMYPLIKDEHQEIIWKAFADGASLTPKGAVTYLYNITKEFKKKPKYVVPFGTPGIPNSPSPLCAGFFFPVHSGIQFSTTIYGAK